MVAYEFYSHDPADGDQVIGVLPERRTNPERITQECILKWGRDIFSNSSDNADVFFIQVAIDDKSLRVLRPIPFSISHKEISR